jgi:hypothetical protein
MPSRLDTPIGRTCLRGTQTRRPRRREHPDGGADKTAGMMVRSRMTKAPSPGRGSRSDWCTIRREPPGPPARLWQTFRKEDSAAAGPYARSNVGRIEGSSRRPSPPCQRDACSGNRRRTRRRKEPHKILRQVASGASSETSKPHPEGDDPDRRRSLGFLTVSICRVATRREFGDTSADPRDKARG